MAGKSPGLNFDAHRAPLQNYGVALGVEMDGDNVYARLGGGAVYRGCASRFARPRKHSGPIHLRLNNAPGFDKTNA